MTMNKLLLILGGVVAAAVLLVAGIALGDVLADDAPAEADVATDTDPAGDDAAGPRQVAAATAVPLDQSAAPTAVPVVDETTPPTWPAPSPFQVVDPTDDGSINSAADDLAALYDPETGIDSGTTGEPWVPPTSPAFDAETDEVDPEAPAERAEGAEHVPADEVEDLFIPYLGLDLPFRFVDDCAGDAPGTDEDADESECPEGVGGTIALTGGGAAPEPLDIMRQLYTTIGVPLELRCSPLGFSADGTHRAIFATNNPADFTITYWPSTERSAARTIEYSTPEAERDLWLERQLAGEPTYASMHTGVHNCPEIAGLFPGRHTTFEVRGVDDAGTEDVVTIYFTPSTAVAGNVSVGRPHASFVPLDRHSNHGVLTVPYNEHTEQVYVASLPRAGQGATTESCTDVENGVLNQTQRHDVSLWRWDTADFPRAEDDGFEPGIESSLVTTFVGEEGTTYDLCVWVTKPPRRSFDKPPVVMREVFTVRPPRRWRVRLLVGGGHTDAALDANAISVRPTNWPYSGAATWPSEPVPAGAFMLDEMEVLRDGGSSLVPPITLLRVTGPAGTTTEVSIPTMASCMFPFPCDHAGFDHYDIAIPGRTTRHVLCGGGGDCGSPTDTEVVGNLRLVVETYAGPGGAPTGRLDGADGWQVDHALSFPAAMIDAAPPIPRIDQNSVVLEPVGGTDGIAGGRPGLRFHASFDRLVQVTAVPQVAIGNQCPVPVVAQSTDGLSQYVDMTFEGLCWGSTYGIDLVATDAAGNVLDTRTIIDGVRTGRGAWRIVDMPRVGIAEYSVRVTVNQLGEGYGASHLRVGPIEVVPYGVGVRCVAGTEPHEVTIRNSGGRPITISDPWDWTLEVNQSGDGRDCGDRRHGEGMRIHATVPLDQLLAGPATVHYTHEDGTDVVLEVYDVVFAE